MNSYPNYLNTSDATLKECDNKLLFNKYSHSTLLLTVDLLNAIPSIQENMELSGDGYQADVIGESTPDVLVSEFVSVSSFNLLHVV